MEINFELWPSFYSGTLCMLDSCTLLLVVKIIENYGSNKRVWISAGILVAIAHAFFASIIPILGSPIKGGVFDLLMLVIGLDGAFYMYTHMLKHLVGYKGSRGVIFSSLFGIGSLIARESGLKDISLAGFFLLILGSSYDGALHSGILKSELPDEKFWIGVGIFGLVSGAWFLLVIFNWEKWKGKSKLCCHSSENHDDHSHSCSSLNSSNPTWRQLIASTLLIAMIANLVFDLIDLSGRAEIEISRVVYFVFVTAYLNFTILGFKTGLIPTKLNFRWLSVMEKKFLNNISSIKLVATALVSFAVTWLFFPFSASFHSNQHQFQMAGLSEHRNFSPIDFRDMSKTNQGQDESMVHIHGHQLGRCYPGGQLELRVTDLRETFTHESDCILIQFKPLKD